MKTNTTTNHSLFRSISQTNNNNTEKLNNNQRQESKQELSPSEKVTQFAHHLLNSKAPGIVERYEREKELKILIHNEKTLVALWQSLLHYSKIEANPIKFRVLSCVYYEKIQTVSKDAIEYYRRSHCFLLFLSKYHEKQNHKSQYVNFQSTARTCRWQANYLAYNGK